MVSIANLITHFFGITGPSLPYSLLQSAMAKSPDGRGVILFGGDKDEYYYEKRLLELRADANSWNILEITLQNARKNHLVIAIFF